MAKRKLMFLLGSILILSLVVAYSNLNWSTDVTTTTPEESTTDDSTTGDNTDTTPEESTTDDDTTGDNSDPAPEEPATEEPPTEEPPTEPPTEEPPTEEPPTNDPLNITIAEALGNNEDDHEDEEDYIWDSSDVITITLNIDSISVDDENGTTIDETTVTITSAGNYNISGTLADGQIVVDSDDEEVVRLILNGVNISSTTNAPIYVEDANKTVIVLADNTENYLTDNVGNEDNGSLLSRDDLTIYGNGSLTVSGNANDAIRSNDGLIIKSGNITVTSVDDGIRGKDYLVIKGGNITVNSVGDGLKSDNAAEESRGYISIEDCTIAITSTKGDAVTAQTDLLVTGGTFTLTSGGGSAVAPDDNVSTKGLKAVVCVVIDGGDFVISSSDDAVHSDHMILINNGTFDISSGDEGMSAFSSMEINNGTVVITKSNDGMQSEIITINSCNIQVTSGDEGVSSNDCLVIEGGEVTVNSVGDGLRSDNDENATKGSISIDGGTITVTSTEGDAITAQTDLLITGGTFMLTSGGGGAVVPDDDVSTKGLKAGVNLTIDDGDFVISSSDDGIHSDDVILINNGTYSIASGDDGIHADNSVEINNGTFVISQSFEGIESTNVTINDGHFQITSSDDGINVGDGRMMGPPGEFYIFIRGGFIYIDSGADGLDSDGYIVMSGGTVIIDGPVGGEPNAALDYGEGEFNMTGGMLVGVGMSFMAEAPSPTSTQYSVLVNLNAQRSANTLAHFQTSSGEAVLTFRPAKAYQSIVFSSPDLAPGSYDLYLGGSSTGTLSYGIYEDGTYSPGTKYTDFTISEIVTTIGGTGFPRW